MRCIVHEYLYDELLWRIFGQSGIESTLNQYSGFLFSFKLEVFNPKW